jgi:hypothetical protein
VTGDPYGAGLKVRSSLFNDKVFPAPGQKKSFALPSAL